MSIRYRSDIEGLRAVAIIPVVAFHAVPSLAPGGYVGVDVFFVISGFLISSLLIQRLRDGDYSIATFYRARIRRIFPALFFMLTVVSAISVSILPPSQLMEFGKTSMATTLFASNFEFFRLADYFAGSSEFKPLLHTWSLAVEEQFYIFFPPLLAMLFKSRRAYVPIVIVSAALISLIASSWATFYYPTLNFYFTGTRAFELLIGATLALELMPAVRIRALRELLSLSGLMMIAAAIAFYDSSTPFPGAAALLPCVGTALLIYAGANGASLTTGLLSKKPLRLIGLISYALYLWHWPLLVFVRHYSLGTPSNVLIAGAVAAAVGFAMLSFHFIEKPFRKVSDGDNRLFVFGILVMMTVGGVGGVLYFSRGLPVRFDAVANRFFAAQDDFSQFRSRCHGEPDRPIRYDHLCVFGEAGVPPSVAVWGDSHGAELAVALGELLAKDAKAVMQITSSGCPPAQGFYTKARPKCAMQNAETLTHLGNDKRIDTVVIVARYSLHLSLNAPALKAGLERSVAHLIQKKKQVVVVSAFPDFPYSAPMALGVLSARGSPLERFGSDLAEYEARNAESYGFLRRLASATGAILVSVSSDLCEFGRCSALKGGKTVMYFDDNHPSVTGARYVARSILEELSDPVGKEKLHGSH